MDDAGERLTEAGLLKRRSAFVGEIQELEENLDSVVNDPEKEWPAEVVTEISTAVEKSKYVLRDLEEAIRTYRSAKLNRRAFTDEEQATFRFFGFDASAVTFDREPLPPPRAASASGGAATHRLRSTHSSPSLETETETNVFDAYKTRPSPEAQLDPEQLLLATKAKSLSKSPSPQPWDTADRAQKINMEAVIQSEVESRLGTLMLAAEAELESRSKRVLDERIKELVTRFPGGAAQQQPPLRSEAVTAEVQTEVPASDFADLFGLDSPDDLEAKLNEMVQQRLQVERSKLGTASGAAAAQDITGLSPEGRGSPRGSDTLQAVVAEMSRDNDDLRERIRELEDTCAQQRGELARAAQRQKSSAEAQQRNADFVGAVSRLEGVIDELGAAATATASALGGSTATRCAALEKLQGLVAVKARDEISFLKLQLQSARETYRQEIAALGGRLEGDLVTSTEVSQLLTDTQKRLAAISGELVPKVYDYATPVTAAKGEQSPTTAQAHGPDKIDVAVAQVLRGVRCPVPIDCHKIAPGEYYLDRKVKLRLVDGVPLVIRRQADAPALSFEQYVRRLYLPFIHQLDMSRADQQAGQLFGAADFHHDADLYTQHGAEGEVPPFDEGSMREFRKLRAQQRDLMRQLRQAPTDPNLQFQPLSAGTPGPPPHTPAAAWQGSKRGEPPFVAHSGTPAAAAAASYTDLHARRGSGAPAEAADGAGYSGQPLAEAEAAGPLPQQAAGYTADERSLLWDFFELIDRGGVGLVSKQQILRSLRRYPDVAGKLRILANTPLPDQLEAAIDALPGGDRELPWDAFYSLFVDIRQQHYRDAALPPPPRSEPPLQRGATPPAQGHPSSIAGSAKAFNERIQARQREMTRELLDTPVPIPAAPPYSAKLSRASSRGRTPGKQAAIPLGGDRMTKSQVLRTQATEARRNRKPAGL
eukprot:TRINITY_DN4756_c0_g1_i1.p1 TRINITY_DN4756_c0_g1~~TRINITY_DN4756_c0_g1_i1.p1  ORF type:complete len:955 (+),score=247.86 TRINITY_DN4756_c0_g1_i1:67-2865(+)